MSRFTSPFAFLGRSAAATDDDKDDKNKSKSKAEETNDEEGEDEVEKKKDEENDDAKGKGKSKSKADSDDDDDKKKKDDEDDDKAKSKKGAKSKAEDDDEDDTSASAKAIRARERSRVRAILTSPAGQADPVAAAHVALDTGMPRADAIAMLSAMQLSRDAMGAGASASSRAGLGDRMGSVPNPDVGADGGNGRGPSMADRIIAAGKKARGEA